MSTLHHLVYYLIQNQFGFIDHCLCTQIAHIHLVNW